MRRAPSRWLQTAALAGAAVCLLWPAFWNRGPFVVADTRSYLRGADAAVHKLTHRSTVWTAPDTPAVEPVSADALHNVAEARTRSLEDIGRKGVVLGRSAYYGLLLYTGTLGAGFWLPLLLQAGAVLLAVWLTLRALELPAWPCLAWLGLALCLVPATPFYVSYLLPDLFAGLAVLACAVVLTARRLPALDALLWFLLLTAALLFHDSCVLIAAALLALAVAANLLRRRWANGRGVGLVLLALIVSAVGQSVVIHGIRKATGEAPLRLPFLAARLVADGPGATYLRATCPGNGFALCAYVNQFPISDSDFLFGAQPGHAVFETAPYAERQAISAQQVRFFLAVLRYDPAGVLKASARGAAEQLVDFRLATFRYDASTRGIIDRTFPLPVARHIQASAAYRGTLPVTALSVVLYVWVLAALAYLLVLAGRWQTGAARQGDLRRLLGWIAAGIVVNAVVCGALSAVDCRYQARVIWLLPLLALLVWLVRSSASGRRVESR